MKAKYIHHEPRKKAFIGAAVGMVAGTIGKIISNKKQKKAEELAFKQQQEQQNRNDNMAQAAALSQLANNNEFIDEYKKRITLRCGGRKKAFLGAGAGNAMSGIGGLASAILTKPSASKVVKQGAVLNVPQEQKTLVNEIYPNNPNVNPIIPNAVNTNISNSPMYKIGGRKTTKCK